MFGLLRIESLDLLPVQRQDVTQSETSDIQELSSIAFSLASVGEKIHLATYSATNNRLVLYAIGTKQLQVPSTKRIEWGTSGYGKIKTLVFDKLGVQLVAVSVRYLYVLPFTVYMKHNGGTSPSPSRGNDIREVKLPSALSGVHSCTAMWWQTASNREIVIIGTEKGDLFFIDIDDKKCVYNTHVNGHILRMELVPDDRQHITYLLISGRSSLQWRLLLDILDIDLHMTLTKEKMASLGYMYLGGKKYIKSILHSRAHSSSSEYEFQPHRFTNIPISVSLRYQSAKGCHLLSAIDKADQSLKVYDSSMEHHPLFEYNLSLWTEHLVYTDRLIFCALPYKYILVLANQLSERNLNSQQTGHVVCQYNLEEDESIKYISAVRFPTSWYNNLVDTSAACDCTAQNHTILDGCLLITNKRLIQLVPGLSPEQLFLNWSTSSVVDLERLESLARITHIDILNLYLQSAEYHLRKGNLEPALECLSYSKCDELTKIIMLYKHNQYELVIQLSRDMLRYTESCSTTSQSTSSDTCDISDKVLHAFLCVLDQQTEELSFYNQFREFLLYSQGYSLDKATKLLCQKGYIPLLLELALARRFIQGALEHVFSQEKLTPQILHRHIDNKDFIAALSSISSGVIVYLLGAQDFCTYLLISHDIKLSNLRWFVPRLHTLDQHSLNLLAQRYHPHSRFVQSAIIKYKDYMDSLSAQSYASVQQDIDEGDNSRLSSADFTSAVYLFYVQVLLKLSSHTEYKCLLSSDLDMLGLQVTTDLHSKKSNTQMILEGMRRGRPLSCCSTKVYFLSKNVVFCWGSRAKLDDMAMEDRVSVSIPNIALNFSNDNIDVKGISCGERHLMVLCSDGLRGCGSSAYGQVGAGDFQEYEHCVQVSLDCVDVVCGRYHTLAVDKLGRVYSWGWGLFGQLGHADISNQASPKPIDALAGVFVTSLAAGHSHSIILSHQGDMYIFGSNVFGQVDSTLTTTKACVPVLIQLNSPVTLISTKYFHSIAVTESGVVALWGIHPYVAKKKVQSSKLSSESSASVVDPSVMAETFKGRRVFDMGDCTDTIVKVACGTSHCLLLTDTGLVFIWEEIIGGRQVPADATSQVVPTDTELLTLVHSLSDIVYIACDYAYSMALASDGTLHSWGRNHNGQLGLALRNVRQTKTIAKVKLPQSYLIPSTQEMYRNRVNVCSQHQVDDSMGGSDVLELSSLSLLEYFPVQQALSLAISNKVYRAIIALFYSSESWNEALFYHLKSSLCYQGHLKDNYCTEILKIIGFYLGKLVEGREGYRSQNITQLIYRVLQFWQARQLPVGPELEDMLLSHLKLLSPTLYQLLLNDRSLSKVEESLVNQFSSSFLASIVRSSMKMWSVGCKREDRSSMWSGVVKTLHKEQDVRSSTTITHFELARLNTDFDSEHSYEVVAFTCGHHFTRQNLVNKMIPAFESRIRSKLPIASSVVMEIYRGDDYTCIACPQCVHSSMHTLAS